MIPYTTISDSHITLRPFQFNDAGDLYMAVRESMADLKPWMSWAHNDYAQSEARDYIAVVRARWGENVMYSFAITDARSGAFIGACSLSHIHPVYFHCNLGYWIRTSQRGRGAAGQAARMAAHFAFEKLRLVRVEVVVAVGNEASLKVAEKIGAHREGILRNRILVGKEAHDAVMFSFIPQDFGLQARL
ncbi:MAG: GNAT family N-acetyltransferase [Chloroflexi bacterium]|nr:GNAT family N-acetyltransferase [Chloroflexota bacterium]